METNNFLYKKSFGVNCSCTRPLSGPSLIPIFVEGLIKGNPKGKNPEDLFVRALINQNEDVYKSILTGWETMSKREKRLGYGIPDDAIGKGDWVQRLEFQTKLLVDHRKKEKKELQTLVNLEFSRALSSGAANWQPSEELKNRKTLSYLVQKKIWERLAISDNAINKCCSKADGDDEPKPKTNYGIKLSKITCLEKDETGHDEVYIMSIVVDNTGVPVLKTSKVFSMNDSDENVKYPDEWLYPWKDPKGYMDIAATLWEDDGGYKEAAAAAAALAAGLAAIPDVTATKVAAIALGVVSGLLTVAGWLDSNDNYGTIAKTWASEPQLHAEVGSFVDSIINYDTGWTDFTSYHYEIQFDLLNS